MGYYVQIQESNWIIPADKLDDAYKAMCELNKRDDLKTGGSWDGGKQTQKWFAWMDANYPETCEDADTILHALGFGTGYDGEGNLYIYSYDDKSGAEEHFLAAIAPFSKPDSYIVWRGEDGAIWRDIVQHDTLVQQSGTIVFNQRR